MKKIIAIVFTILTITSLTACGNKATTNGNDYKPSIDDTIVEETPTYNVIDELDKTVREYLGDDVIETDYKDDTYYILIAIEDVNSAYIIMAADVDESIDSLSETINDTFDIDCVIFVVDDATHDDLLYATLNGNDITDQLD